MKVDGLDMIRQVFLKLFCVTEVKIPRLATFLFLG